MRQMLDGIRYLRDVYCDVPCPMSPFLDGRAVVVVVVRQFDVLPCVLDDLGSPLAHRPA